MPGFPLPSVQVGASMRLYEATGRGTTCIASSKVALQLESTADCPSHVGIF